MSSFSMDCLRAERNAKPADNGAQRNCQPDLMRLLCAGVILISLHFIYVIFYSFVS